MKLYNQPLASQYITERKIRTLETNPKSVEISHFYPNFLVHLGTFIKISLKGKCNVSSNHPHSSTYLMKQKLTKPQFEEIAHYLYFSFFLSFFFFFFFAIGEFYCDFSEHPCFVFTTIF